MFHLNTQKIVISFSFFLLFGATKILACGCVSLPDESVSAAVKRLTERSAVVFAGKVVGFEYRKGIPNEYMDSREKDSGKHIDYETLLVKFKVERWWKGEAAREIVLVTEETKNSDGTGSGSSCDYHFKDGESYLVYAYGKESELRTHSCTRTKPLANAGEDLKILGEGKEPVEVHDVNRPKRLSVTNYPVSFSVAIPFGWRAYKSANGLQNLIPNGQKDEKGTDIYVWVTPGNGKKATKLFDSDELLTTLDGKSALVRYGRVGGFQSIIRLSDPTNPCATAYIEEGDFFVEVSVSSTDANFDNAKQAFKTIVESYRRIPSKNL